MTYNRTNHNSYYGIITGPWKYTENKLHVITVTVTDGQDSDSDSLQWEGTHIGHSKQYTSLS